MSIIEIFKDIPNFHGLYQVSNLGRVKSLERYAKHWQGGDKLVKERMLKPCANSGGYLIVMLSKNGVSGTKKVHQLVAMAFLNHKPCGMKLVTNHINFDKTDNRLENIEIVTSRENTNQKHLKSTSKYVGVYWNNQTKKWMAQIRVNGKQKHLGSFTNEHNAHLTYQQKLNTLNYALKIKNHITFN